MPVLLVKAFDDIGFYFKYSRADYFWRTNIFGEQTSLFSSLETPSIKGFSQLY